MSKMTNLVFVAIFIPLNSALPWGKYFVWHASDKSIISFSYCVQNLVNLNAWVFFQFTTGLMGLTTLWTFVRYLIFGEVGFKSNFTFVF
jgi:hypothetical protein